MTDLIGREQAIQLAQYAAREAYRTNDYEQCQAFEQFIETLKKIPAVKEQPEIHAHWVPENSRSRSSLWLCSHCMQKAYYIIGNYKHSFAKPKTIPYELCPHCGAIMDEQT